MTHRSQVPNLSIEAAYPCYTPGATGDPVLRSIHGWIKNTGATPRDDVRLDILLRTPDGDVVARDRVISTPAPFTAASPIAFYAPTNPDAVSGRLTYTLEIVDIKTYEHMWWTRNLLVTPGKVKRDTAGNLIVHGTVRNQEPHRVVNPEIVVLAYDQDDVLTQVHPSTTPRKYELAPEEEATWEATLRNGVEDVVRVEAFAWGEAATK